MYCTLGSLWEEQDRNVLTHSPVLNLLLPLCTHLPHCPLPPGAITPVISILILRHLLTTCHHGHPPPPLQLSPSCAGGGRAKMAGNGQLQEIEAGKEKEEDEKGVG